MLAAFERLEGLEARQAAQRFWEDPTPQNRSDYFLICSPLLLAVTQRRRWNLSVEEATELVKSNKRLITNRTLSDYFIAGENRTFDLLRELRRIESPRRCSPEMQIRLRPLPIRKISCQRCPKGWSSTNAFQTLVTAPFFSASRRFITRRVLPTDFIRESDRFGYLVACTHRLQPAEAAIGGNPDTGLRAAHVPDVPIATIESPGLPRYLSQQNG